LAILFYKHSNYVMYYCYYCNSGLNDEMMKQYEEKS